MVSQWLMLSVGSLLLVVPRIGVGADPSQYVIEAPDVLRVEVSGLPKQATSLQGQHLVRLDGTISFGAYGSVSVSGLTVEQARSAVARHLAPFAKKKGRFEVRLEILAYNSKVYYVITAEQIVAYPALGDETVVGAVLQIEGLAAAATKGPVCLARASGKVLQIDWRAITQDGKSATNFKMEAGDRLYVGTPPTK